MAQPNTAQREPSMEEILASIRRIIEDSEAGRKSDDALDFARADNDHASALPQSRPQHVETGTVLDVEAFRAELRAPARSASAAKGHALDFLDRKDADPAVEDKLKAIEPEPLSIKPTASVHAMPSMDDWRLGAPEPVERLREPERFVLDHLGGVDAMLEEAITSDGFASRFGDNNADAEPSFPAQTEVPSHEMSPVRGSIISDHTGRQVAAAFGDLADAFASRSQKSIETMAEDMLRPMLQDWLDNNLPHLVEKLVREEIERVARGS